MRNKFLNEKSQCLRFGDLAEAFEKENVMGAKINPFSGIINALGRESSLSREIQTPLEYNGGQHYVRDIRAAESIDTQLIKKSAKYCISVDWFECTTTGKFLPTDVENPPETLDFLGIILKLDGYGTKHYQHKYNIYLPGEKDPFALILTAPRNTKILAPDFSQIKIENHQLYRMGWNVKLTAVFDALGLQLNNITRLDIAIDGKGFLSPIERFERGEIESIGKVQTCDFKTAQRDRTGYNWGKRSSEKQITIYDKSAELKRTNKSYIFDTWMVNDLNGGQLDQIERLELKLKGKALKRLMIPDTGEAIQYERLEEAAYLAGIVKASFTKWFEFVLPDNQKNITRKERVQIIDFEQFKAIEMQRLPTTQKPNEIWRAKMATSKLLADAKQPDGYLPDAVHQFLHAYLQTFLAGEQRDMITDAVHARMLEIFKDLKTQLPVGIAYAMAKEHQIVDWLERKEAFIEKELALSVNRVHVV